MFKMYTSHYTDRSKADIFKYYDDGKTITKAFYNKPLDYLKIITGIKTNNNYFHTNYFDKMTHWYRPWDKISYNDNRTVIRFNALVGVFSGNNYHTHTLFMCFVSLMGTLLIIKSFNISSAYTTNLALLALFLNPSFIFWTSGVLKEGILLLGLGLFLFGLLKPKNLNTITAYLFGIFLLALIKPYFIGILLPLSILYFIASRFSTTGKKIMVYAIGIVVFTVGIIGLEYQGEKFNLVFAIYKNQEDFLRLAEVEKAKSLIHNFTLENSPISLIKNAPMAFINSFLRPLPTDINSPLLFIAFLENFIYLTLFCWVIIKWRAGINHKNDNVFLFLLLVLLLIFLLIGWSVPVLGGIVRYRAPLFPLIIGLVIQLTHIPQGRLTKKWLS